MNALAVIDKEVAAEPIAQSVARLHAGFRHMDALATELAMLDLVDQDVVHMQARIRRDIANSMLQTATSLQARKAAADNPVELRARLEPASDASETDLWARKLVRWADRLGRSLFGAGRAQPLPKKDSVTLPIHKP